MCAVNFRIVSHALFFLMSFSHRACFSHLTDFSQIVCSRLQNRCVKKALVKIKTRWGLAPPSPRGTFAIPLVLPHANRPFDKFDRILSFPKHFFLLFLQNSRILEILWKFFLKFGPLFPPTTASIEDYYSHSSYIFLIFEPTTSISGGVFIQNIFIAPLRFFEK